MQRKINRCIVLGPYEDPLFRKVFQAIQNLIERKSVETIVVFSPNSHLDLEKKMLL